MLIHAYASLQKYIQPPASNPTARNQEARVVPGSSTAWPTFHHQPGTRQRESGLGPPLRPRTKNKTYLTQREDMEFPSFWSGPYKKRGHQPRSSCSTSWRQQRHRRSACSFRSGWCTWDWDSQNHVRQRRNFLNTAVNVKCLWMSPAATAQFDGSREIG